MNGNRLYLSTNEKISLISNLETMLSAGIPILDAVASLQTDAKGNAKKVLTALHADLTEGKRVHTTLAKFPRVFNEVTVSLVKASEEAGTLTQILKDLKASIKKEAEFSDKIKSALAYPLLIMVIFVLVLLMILVVVIPRIATVFSRLTIELPLPTKILIAASNLLLQQTVPVVIGFSAITAATVIIYRRNRELILNPFLSLPLVSDLVRKIDLARFAHSMHLLLGSGLPLPDALVLAEHVVLKKSIARVIHNLQESVSSGKQLAEGLRTEKKLIPNIMVKLIEVGDKTGTLEKSMADIAEYMEYEVDNSLKAITILLEPIMLVFVGIAVGGMMLSIIAPIYGLIGQVGVR
jgi:type II secretory pathway component PulF